MTFYLPLRKSHRRLGYGDIRKCSTERREGFESIKLILHLTGRKTESQTEIYCLDVASLP